MTRDDPVRVENAVFCFMALKQANIPSELDVYPTGGHGYGLRRAEHFVTTWPDRAAGVEALPFPRIGERYEFELTTVDGKKIRSSDLRGKVVLLDFWARWCGPCMAKMPKLKETCQKLHDRGFEVVGLNHDYTLEQARRITAEQKLPWPNVLAPVEKGRRDLWLEATGTGALPRLLLIDRNGILRADVSPYKLDAEISKLMDQP